MPVKRVNLRSSYIGQRARQEASGSIWELIRRRVAVAILAEKIYNIAKPYGYQGRQKLRDLAPDLYKLLPRTQYLDAPWYESQKSLTYIIRHMKFDRKDYNKKEVPMVDESKLTFELDELVEFIYKYRQKTHLYWWVGTYEPDRETPDLVSTSLRGYMEGKLWSPVPDETAKCCVEFADKVDEIGDAEREDFDPYVWMRHCCEKDHIRSVLQRRTVAQLEAEHEYMLELALQALTENV